MTKEISNVKDIIIKEINGVNVYCIKVDYTPKIKSIIRGNCIKDVIGMCAIPKGQFSIIKDSDKSYILSNIEEIKGFTLAGSKSYEIIKDDNSIYIPIVFNPFQSINKRIYNITNDIMEELKRKSKSLIKKEGLKLNFEHKGYFNSNAVI